MGKINQPNRTRGSLASRSRLGIIARFKGSRTARKIFTGAVPVFLLAFVAAFMSTSIFAPAELSDAATQVSATLNEVDYFINIDSEAVAINVDAYPGEGRTSVVKSTVKTKTNAPGGYKLYLGMDSSATSTGLCLETDSSECISTLTAATPASQSVLAANTWGYAISSSSSGVPSTWTTVPSVVTNAVPSEVTQTFAAVPESGDDQLIQSGSANATSASDTNYTPVDVYYGVRATIAKPAGTYSNTVAYTAVGNASTTPTVFGLSPATYARPSTLSASSVGTASTQTLVATTSIYTNWPGASTPETAPTITLTGGPKNTTYTCTNPTQYVENSVLKVSCTLPQAYAANYTMRIQVPDFGIDYSQPYQYTTTWSTVSFMQEMPFGPSTTTTTSSPTNQKVCDTAGTVTTSMVNATSAKVPEVFLADVRSADKGGYIQSGKYRIRKLADQHCWMTENYAFPQQTSQYYYSYDTNLTQDMGSSLGYTTLSSGVIRWRPSNNYITQSDLTSCPSGGPTDTTVTNDHTYYGYGSSCSSDTATTADTTSTSGQAAETQKIGAYYNWAAATARSGGDSGDAPNSVCPYGWRLPSGGSSSTDYSFAKLMNTYGYGNNSTGSTKARQYPLSYIFSGYYYWGNGNLYSQGTNGYWWSTSANSSTYAYNLGMNSSGLNPQNSLNKAYGLTLRCVAL